jgi:hypothetical protein
MALIEQSKLEVERARVLLKDERRRADDARDAMSAGSV